MKVWKIKEWYVLYFMYFKKSAKQKQQDNLDIALIIS